MVLTIYQNFQTFVIVLGLAALFTMLRRDSVLEQRQLSYVIFGAVITDIGIIVQMNSGTLQTMTLYSKFIQNVGLSIMMVTLIVYVGQVCHYTIPYWVTAIQFVLYAIICYFCSLDADGFTYFYAERHYVTMNGTVSFRYVFGPAGYAFLTFTILLPCIFCVVLLLKTFIFDTKRGRRKDIALLILCFILGIVFVCLYLTKILFAEFDICISIVTFILSILEFSEWKNKGLDVVAAASKSAIEAIDAGVITVNQYLEILYFNPAARNVIPDIDNYMGAPISAIDGIDISGIEDNRVELHYHGHRYFVQYSEIRDSDNQIHGYAVMFNDMTDMYEMMERIQKERERANEAVKVKTEFLTNISHEVRTPMNAIVGLSELIIEESRGRKVYDFAVTIKKSTLTLLNLFNNILDFSKLQEGKTQVFHEEYDLQELMKVVVNMTAIAAAGKGLNLIYNVDSNLPSKLIGDEGKMRQILTHIMSNAVKFTDEGQVSLDITGNRKENKVELICEIKDTGCGMTKEQLDYVFESFSQAEEAAIKSNEGIGLGLTITQGFIKLLGGVICIESEVGKGSTFTFRVSQEISPNSNNFDSSNIIDNPVVQREMFEAPSIEALIVDDNSVNLLVARTALALYKMKIDTASSGPEAIKMCSEKEYDLILMDHMMPEMDGITATGIIRKNYAATGVTPKIVALTANAYSGLEEIYTERGFDDFIEKPINRERLYDSLVKIIPESLRTYTNEEHEDCKYTEDELAEIFIEGVDARKALTERDCSVPDYLELLDLFVAEGKEKSPTIRSFYEAKDYENYRILVHGIKSAAANIGAMRVSELAKEQEFAAKDENYQLIDDGVDLLEVTYEKLITDIEKVLEKINSNKVEVKDIVKEPISKEKLLEVLHQILEFSESFNSKEAANLADSLQNYELSEEVEKQVADIRMKYKLYDDDGAEDLLHSLIESIQ